MAYPQGINFRATEGYVTDISPADFDAGTAFNPTYPLTTAQGNTVGWEGAGGIDTRDRSTAPDARLAGINFVPAGGSNTVDYRFDLTSTGDWKMGLACGDYSGVQGPMRIEIFDTSTSRGRLVDDVSTSAAARFFDASGVERTDVTWPTDHVLVTKNFTTTICRFRVGGSNLGGVTVIAHAYVESAGSAIPGMMSMYRQRRI